VSSQPFTARIFSTSFYLPVPGSSVALNIRVKASDRHCSLTQPTKANQKQNSHIPENAVLIRRVK